MVEKGADPAVSPLRRSALRAARSLTTPLLPDDYFELMNPLWSTRELRGRVEEVRPESPDASTIVVLPSFPWPGHKPGQYLRIGAEINGVRHWRAYSLTSDPDHPKGLISITVKRVEEGKMSPYFTGEVQPGSMVFLGGVEGTFGLPDPLPEKSLFISAGSGITPILSMIRELNRADHLDDVVHIHCVRNPDDFIFGEMLRSLSKRAGGYELKVHLSSEEGRITPADLDSVCADWRDRDAFISGPREMLDSMKEHWEAETDPERLRMERFQPVITDTDAEKGEGGTIHFRVTEVEASCDGSTPILVAGEEAGGELPFGCRQGVCHTCIGRLQHGRVRDLRTGEVHGEEGQMVRTCINAPEGHVEIDL
jgi:stearoyl-CoA 9-desaturase NADPH oxidoreductase